MRNLFELMFNYWLLPRKYKLHSAYLLNLLFWMFLFQCLLALADLRDYHGFEHKDLLDKTFGTAVRVMGPKVVLEAVPLSSQLSRSAINNS